MRGLTILPPWIGMKVVRAEYGPPRDRGCTVEFRSRPTNIREVIALRTGADHIPCSTCPVGGRGDCDEYWPRCHEEPEGLPAEWARSSVVATAELVDCRPVTEADREVPGCPPDLSGFAWVFTDLRALPEPVACKPPRGAQTWFTLPEDIEAEVLQSLTVGVKPAILNPSLEGWSGVFRVSDSNLRPRQRAGPSRDR